MNGFLPISKQDMTERGWYYCDFLIVTGDAYVDHPSFGTAIISRVLEDAGYKVAILSQPDFRDEHDFLAMGRPRYAVLINGGNIDSMVAHYTSAKKRRSDDAYTPGGKGGKRPDRAVTVYSMLARRAFPDTPVYLGGIEASLRRFAHYDYWADRVMPSILESTGADGVMYGMSEHSVVELANNLRHGRKGADACVGVRGTAYMAHDAEGLAWDAVECPSYEDVCASKPDYARSVKLQYDEQDAVRGRALLQRHARAHPESAREAADHRGDGSHLCAALYAHLSSFLRGARRRSGHSGGSVFYHSQPRLLRRVQFLRTCVPSGTLHSGAQP